MLTKKHWEAKVAIARARLRYARDQEKSDDLSFDDWLQEVSPTWSWHWPHLALGREYLQRVTDGELKRLMILMPPRHGKTHQNTIRYPIYRLERDRKLRVVVGCYNQTRATEFGRLAKRIAATRFAFADDRKAADDWQTIEGGGFRSVGIGSGIGGIGADLFCLDDVVKSREEAESVAYRERLWDWYTNDCYERLEPGGAIVLTYTPWHSDDIGGRILNSGDAKNWTVLRLPALAEDDDPLGRAPGEALCPERFDAPYLINIRDNVSGSYAFSALYQCRPTPHEGGMFKRQWLRYWKREDLPDGGWAIRLYDESHQPLDLVLPDRCKRFGTADLAFTTKTQNDATALGAWALDHLSRLILLDVFHERVDAGDLIPEIARFHERWDLLFTGVEDNQAQTIAVKMLRRPPYGLAIRGLHADKAKEVRAVPAQIRMEVGDVYLPLGHPKLGAIENELLTFPSGEHDDIVDMMAYGAAQAYRLVRGYKPKQDEKTDHPTVVATTPTNGDGEEQKAEARRMAYLSNAPGAWR